MPHPGRLGDLPARRGHGSWAVVLPWAGLGPCDSTGKEGIRQVLSILKSTGRVGRL